MALTPPFSVFDSLFERRVVFLRGPLDSAAATQATAQLLLLAQTDPTRAVELYVDVSRASLGAALAVYDAMQALQVRVSTTCIGVAVGAAALVLAGGAAGVRYALPSARVHLTLDPLERLEGTAEHLQLGAQEAARLHARAVDLLATHTRQDAQRVRTDLEQGVWLNAEEARTYGILDEVVAPRR